MAMSNRERQAAFKERQAYRGKQQLNVWVDNDTFDKVKLVSEREGVTMNEAASQMITRIVSSNEPPRDITSKEMLRGIAGLVVSSKRY